MPRSSQYLRPRIIIVSLFTYCSRQDRRVIAGESNKQDLAAVHHPIRALDFSNRCISVSSTPHRNELLVVYTIQTYIYDLILVIIINNYKIGSIIHWPLRHNDIQMTILN